MNFATKPILLYIITKSELGGAQGNVYDLIFKFHANYEVHLVTSSHGPLTDDVNALGVPVHLMSNLTRNIQFFSDFAAIQECVTLINKIKPDIIHAHSSKAGVIARIAGWICKVPVVFTAHGWGFSPGTPKLRRIIALLSEKFLAPLTAKLICVSESDHQLALSFGVGNKYSLTTIRYGIHNVPISIANPSNQPPQMIMVARFNEQKDQTILLKAIALIKDQFFNLNFVGSGQSLESCKALAQSLGITNCVSFLEDRRDVPELLAKSQVFILSTHYEGLPISILEAMRAGLPVIATSVNGIPEEIEHGKTGLLVPHGDVQALADALSKLIEFPEIRQKMGEASRQKFLREFTVERMVNEIKAVYEEILKNSIKAIKYSETKSLEIILNIHAADKM